MCHAVLSCNHVGHGLAVERQRAKGGANVHPLQGVQESWESNHSLHFIFFKIWAFCHTWALPQLPTDYPRQQITMRIVLRVFTRNSALVKNGILQK